MVNQVIVVGTLKELPVLKETTNGIKYAHVTVVVKRNFKNSEAIYEYDEITFTLWRGIAENCMDVCEVGSLLAIKGRIQTNPYTSEEMITYKNYEMIAEKVSFMSEG